tara:strand:- start:6207 stop:7427 length:1221 start_codon:yes stop_codon:yes gene_type:complete
MRIGTSVGITQPPDVSKFGYIPKQAELTLNLDGDSVGRKDTDGRLYNIDFPWDFVQWSQTYAVDASTPATLVSDPFADYRVNNTPYVYSAGGINYNRLPAIRDYLTVNLILDSGDVLGSNSHFLVPNPALSIYVSETALPSDEESHFTHSAASNLVVNIKNSGLMGGGGGYGGRGTQQYSVGSKGGQTFAYGGGGGAGSGIHKTPAQTVADWADYGDFTQLPGQGGYGPGNATDGGAGATGSGLPSSHAGGAGGSAATAGTLEPGVLPLSPHNPTNGGGGGDVVAIFNSKYRTENSREDATPTVNLINEDDAHTFAGSGGGGGGGTNGSITGPQAGGAGGGRSSVTSIVNNGTGGAGSYVSSSGGTAGVLVQTNTFTVRSPATVTKTNNHTTGNSIVTMQGNGETF